VTPAGAPGGGAALHAQASEAPASATVRLDRAALADNPDRNFSRRGAARLPLDSDRVTRSKLSTRSRGGADA
jgi:hypothetical protein